MTGAKVQMQVAHRERFGEADSRHTDLVTGVYPALC